MPRCVTTPKPLTPIPAARLHRGGRRVPCAVRRRADTRPPATLPAAEALLAGDRGRVAPAALRHGAALPGLGAVRRRSAPLRRGAGQPAEGRLRQGVRRR